MSPASQFYLDQLADAGLPGAGLDWLGGLREDGAKAFARLGFPTQKAEAWKYTSLRALEKSAFPMPAPHTEASAALADPGAGRLVFLNGRFNADLSRPDIGQKGVRVASLAQLLVEDPGWLESHLAGAGGTDELPLLAFNSAFMCDGFVIHLAPGTIVETPIELIFQADAGADGVHYHPRNLIIAEEGSGATIVERHVGRPGSSFANHASQAVIGQGAMIRHYKLENEDRAAVHISTTLAAVAKGGTYESFVMSTGAGLSRNEIRVRLEGEDARARLDGIYLATGTQHMDHTTVIEHVSPGASSSETYKGALDDQARAVFQGNILVAPDAQKTDGRMNNATLLLSDGAEIDAKPQLEIYADDVKCSHGTTAGQIDDDALFYLRSRGIDEARARAMLVEAFLAELVETIASPEAREIFQARLSDWLEHGGKEMTEK